MGEDAPLVLLWGAVGILSAWGWRWLLPRYVFRFEAKWLALLCAYVSMALMLAFSFWLFENSGWTFKAANDNPKQIIAEYAFFISPIGTPLIVGAPVIFVADILLFLNRKYLDPLP